MGTIVTGIVIFDRVRISVEELSWGGKADLLCKAAAFPPKGKGKLL
jgi:hypothetical protein